DLDRPRAVAARVELDALAAAGAVELVEALAHGARAAILARRPDGANARAPAARRELRGWPGRLPSSRAEIGASEVHPTARSRRTGLLSCAARASLDPDPTTDRDGNRGATPPFGAASGRPGRRRGSRWPARRARPAGGSRSVSRSGRAARTEGLRSGDASAPLRSRVRPRRLSGSVRPRLPRPRRLRS